jgi:hypothetical protein
LPAMGWSPASPEDAGSVVPPCPVVPVDGPARGGMAAALGVGRCRRCNAEHPRRGRRRPGLRWLIQRRHHRPRGRQRGRAAPCRPGGAVGEAGGRQVPVVDVEQAIRQACRRWRVLEIAADPFRWARSLQLLDQEGLPILEYPQSPGRMTPATARFYEAVVNGQLTHSGDHRLARPRRERGTAGGCSRCPAGQGAEGLAPADRRRRGRRHGP